MRRKAHWILILALSFAWLASAQALSQEEDKESLLFMGEETVSTPSRRPQPIDESPSPVTVITAEDITRSGALTIPEALVLLPGVNSLRLSEANMEISLRGFNSYSSDKVLVMLDSRPLFNLADASVDWNLIPVSLEDIERIEVVRGPGSVLYGENAFFGIINIITKAPDKHGSRATAGVGNEESILVNAGLKYPLFSVSIESLYLNRFSTIHTDIPNPLVDELGIRPLASQAHIDRAFFRSDFKFSDSRLNLSAGAARVENEFFDHRDVARSLFASLDESFSDGDIDVNMGLRASFEDHERDDFQFLEGPYRQYTRFDADLRCVYAPFVSDMVVFGVQTSHRTIRDEVYLDPDKKELTQGVFSAYLENQLAFFEKTNFITTGLRMDYYPEIGEILSPQVGLIFLLPHAQAIKMGWGQAFRSPTLYDFYGMDATLSPLIFEGNSDLKQEMITSGNLDYIYQDPRRLTFAVDFYYHDIQDLIVFKQHEFTSTERIYRLENEDRAYSYGGEIELRASLAKQLEIWANYSHTRAYFVNEDKDIEAPFSPRHKANAGVRLDGRKWSTDLWASYVGDQVGITNDAPFQDRIDISEYGTISARVELRFTERLGLSLFMNDLFGEGHFESPVYAPVMPYYFIRLTYGYER
jgi:outer membrane receptor for ferrienterochelin and colicin